MSLITSCPACGTMFRVVPDQLKISEGWVRCGHCGDVFDAAAHLGDEATLQARVAPAAHGPDTSGELPADAAHPQADPTDTVPDDSIRGWESTASAPLASAPATLAPMLAVPSAAPFPLPSSEPAAPAPTPTPAPAPDSGFRDSDLEASSLDAPFVFRRSDLVDPDPVPSVLPPAPGDSRFNEDEAAAEEEQVEQVSFVRQARRQALWRRPLVRVALVLAGFGLAALLALQLAYHDRDRLAASRPALLPLLQEMCAQLDCTLGPPRQIEAIAIESSGFNRLRADTYRLSFNVRNTSGARVATPALELTLTDSQDQPLVRRVLTPADLGRADGAIAAGGEWSGAVGVAVAPGNAGRIAGYRLLAFYP